MRISNCSNSPNFSGFVKFEKNLLPGITRLNTRAIVHYSPHHEDKGISIVLSNSRAEISCNKDIPFELFDTAIIKAEKEGSSTLEYINKKYSIDEALKAFKNGEIKNLKGLFVITEK